MLALLSFRQSMERGLKEPYCVRPVSCSVESDHAIQARKIGAPALVAMGIKFLFG
jgi:hypothetical protein